jgi:hypothetical protein
MSKAQPKRFPVNARALRRGLASLVAGLALAVAVAGPAQAAIVWPSPPKCSNAMWVWTGKQLGFYQKAYEYTQRRVYGGGMEIRYIWVWEVSIPAIRYGLLTAGRATRHCGTRWIPYTA